MRYGTVSFLLLSPPLSLLSLLFPSPTPSPLCVRFTSSLKNFKKGWNVLFPQVRNASNQLIKIVVLINFW